MPLVFHVPTAQYAFNYFPGRGKERGFDSLRSLCQEHINVPFLEWYKYHFLLWLSDIVAISKMKEQAFLTSTEEDIWRRETMPFICASLVNILGLLPPTEGVKTEPVLKSGLNMYLFFFLNWNRVWAISCKCAEPEPEQNLMNRCR